MSTVKDPEEKKSLSLKLDRRNTYGENSNASRTGIRRAQLKGSVQDDESTNAELLAKTSVTGSQRRGFKKQPDVSLGVVLATKRAGKPKFAAPHRPR